MNKNLKELGQFFTPKLISEYMVKLSTTTKNGNILEPSCGEGVFLNSLIENGFKNIDAYEYDTTLNNKSSIPITYESFINQDIDKKYDLIIGNPPYIRWKNLKEELKEELNNNELWQSYFNSLCDYLYIFILKSIDILKDNGELIFITPEYWMHTTHSNTLRNYMIENGYFETIIHFSETPIFDGVNSSIIIFKFIKSKNKLKNIKFVEYNSRKKIDASIVDKIYNNISFKDISYKEIPQFKKDAKWLLATQDIIDELKTYENNCISNDKLLNNTFYTIGDISNIGNGMVSGLDKAFQLNNENLNLTPLEEKSTIKVLKAKSLSSYIHSEYTKYIFITENITEQDFLTNYPNFYNHLLEYKEKLNKRYNYNRDIKYWEWVFLRNYNLFKLDTKKIFIPCKERISHKDYFRFSIVEPEYYPTQDVSAIYLKDDIKESIYYILALLNNFRVFHWLKYNGIIKGNIVEFSEKPISSIPIKLIDWNNENEVKLHNEITLNVKNYITTKNKDYLIKVNELLDKLFI